MRPASLMPSIRILTRLFGNLREADLLRLSELAERRPDLIEKAEVQE
jgi:hypothetical protein